ncbi:MAG: hypothetical protein KGI70_03620 [Patescibacteria group bacterium]|nr:hypothetical protein [Patescibacteria group bacterium]
MVFVAAMLAGCGFNPAPAHFGGGPTVGNMPGISLPAPEQLADGYWLASCWIVSGISGYWVKQEMPDEPVTPGPCPNQFAGVAAASVMPYGYGSYAPPVPYYGVVPYTAYGPMGVGYAPGAYSQLSVFVGHGVHARYSLGWPGW